MRRGAIILCGGKSSRMGQDKATLPFGPECMLQRIVRLISEVIEPANIAVVASTDQSLPPLPTKIRIARDAHPDRGPLEGLAAGLRCLGEDVDAVYATSCDVPLLVPAFVNQMFNFLGDYDIAVPDDQDRLHPLAAVYRVSILSNIQQLLNENQLRVRRLFNLVHTRHVPADDLRSIDPDLTTLKNLNTSEDYRSSLRVVGYKAGTNSGTDLQIPALPEELRSTAAMLRRAYPNGVPSEDFGVLACFLCNVGEMSVRGVAAVLGEINNEHYACYLHAVDVVANGGWEIPYNAAQMDCVRDKLALHGLAEWLREDV